MIGIEKNYDLDDVDSLLSYLVSCPFLPDSIKKRLYFL